MNTVPRDLADLLSPQHKSIWEPKFREYLAKLDGRSRTQKPWRINLYECMLLCRDILVLQDKEVNARKKGPRYSARSPVHSPSAGLQNICNERDANFAKLREVYFNEDADEKVGLTNISVSRELSTYRRSCKAWNDDKTSNQKTSNDVAEFDDDVVYSRGDDIYDLVQKVYNDDNVWHELEKLCNKFLLQATPSAMAVILSIL